MNRFVKKLATYLLLMLSLASAMAAHASFVVDDSIDWLNNGSAEVGYTVDRISFSVLSDGAVTIDLLSVGFFNPSMDTQVYLALDDGDIGLADVQWVNDDGALGADGSLFEMDSYLDVDLLAGDYMLYVAACCYSTEQALDGYRLVTGSDPLSALSIGSVYGNYRATISGDVSLTGVYDGVTEVPLPAAGWFFFSALMLLVGRAGLSK